MDVFNFHEGTKNDLLKKACRTEGFSDSDSASDLFDFSRLMRDEDAVATLVTLRMNGGTLLTRGFPFIDEAIDGIEKYLSE